MDVLKEEPLFSHDHFSEVKAASAGQTEPSKAQDTFGGFHIVYLLCMAPGISLQGLHPYVYMQHHLHHCPISLLASLRSEGKAEG